MTRHKIKNTRFGKSDSRTVYPLFFVFRSLLILRYIKTRQQISIRGPPLQRRHPDLRPYIIFIIIDFPIPIHQRTVLTGLFSSEECLVAGHSLVGGGVQFLGLAV